MGGRKITAKNVKRKGEKTHPNSRRAKQLDRVSLRKEKLEQQRKERKGKVFSRLDRFSFFQHALDPSTTHLSLPSLHELVLLEYLERDSEELNRLQKERRPGRPKCKREEELERRMEAEREEYRSGLEIPDLLTPESVTILRAWTGDPSFVPHLRLIRISASHPDEVVVSQEGKKDKLRGQSAEGGGRQVEKEEEAVGDGEGMDVEDAVLEQEAHSVGSPMRPETVSFRKADSMATMDDIP